MQHFNKEIVICFKKEKQNCIKEKIINYYKEKKIYFVYIKIERMEKETIPSYNNKNI